MGNRFRSWTGFFRRLKGLLFPDRRQEFLTEKKTFYQHNETTPARRKFTEKICEKFAKGRGWLANFSLVAPSTGGAAYRIMLLCDALCARYKIAQWQGKNWFSLEISNVIFQKFRVFSDFLSHILLFCRIGRRMLIRYFLGVFVRLNWRGLRDWICTSSRVNRPSNIFTIVVFGSSRFFVCFFVVLSVKRCQKQNWLFISTL